MDGGFFTATFFPNPEVRARAAQSPEPVTPEVTPEVRLLMILAGEMTRQALQAGLSLKDSEYFRKAYLLPALEAGLIEMTIPDKPRSSKQCYRINKLGTETLKNFNKGK